MNLSAFTSVLLICLTAFFPLRSSASEFFGSGSCAIIVASRPSISEAREWIIANHWQNSAKVYLSDNGWYAIAVAQYGTRNAQERLSAGKEIGLFPSDAYCSTGQRYLREVDWVQTESTTALAPSTELWDEFDARPLTRSEKAFIQSSLALQNEYSGLLDGVWGSGSQRALEHFTRAAFEREPLNSDAAYLAMLMFQAIEEAGWKRHVVEVSVVI